MWSTIAKGGHRLPNEASVTHAELTGAEELWRAIKEIMHRGSVRTDFEGRVCQTCADVSKRQRT